MSIEAMKLALECMEAAIRAGDWKVDGACDPDYAFVCLRAAIEQAERQSTHSEDCYKWHHACAIARIEQAEQAQPVAWVGLTPEEVKEISLANRPYLVDMIVALKQRLKEKNT